MSLFVDCDEFEEIETIEGLKMLMAPKMNKTDKPDKLEAIQWYKDMCLKALWNEEISVLNPLPKLISKTCQHEHFLIGNEDDFERGLESGMKKKLKSKVR